MSVGQLLALAQSVAAGMNAGLGERWANASWRLAGRTRVPMLSYDLQSIGRLDALLRAMEQESVSRDHNEDLLLMDLQSIWSRAWVLVAYECLRTAAQRALGDGTAFARLRDRFALVRVPLAKAEIAQDKKHLGRRVLELGRAGDPPKAPALEYRAGGDVPYIPQGVWNRETGSIGWTVIDLSTSSHVTILRRQLSDELLALAEAA